MSSTVRILGGGNLVKTVALTDGATPSIATVFLVTIADEIIKSTVTKDDASGRYDLSIEQVKDDSVIQAYLEANIDVVNTSAVEQLLFENGTKELAQTSTNQKQLVIVRGGLQGGTTGAARKIGIFPQRLKNSSGAWTQEGEKYNRVTIAFEGFKLGGPLTVASTYLTGVATTAATVTLTTSLPYGTVVYQ